MRPVVLVKMPNQPYFLGTFDVVNLKDWWKSAPLPSDVIDIGDAIWVYGSYHLVLAELSDGSQVVYRSPNYGQNWFESWIPPSRVHKMVRVDYGRALVSAEDGWYETINTGLSWDKVSNDAVSCDDFCQIGNDIILGHDGRYVWKSEDFARHWNKVLDCETVIEFFSYHQAPIYPCISGTNSRVAAGIGDFLAASDNQGDDWYHWQTLKFNGKRIIRKIIVTQVDGYRPDDVRFMVQAKEGDVLRHYLQHKAKPYGYWTFTAAFDTPFSEANHLDSYEVLKPGETTREYMVVSGETRLNTETEAYEPYIRYSINGGDNWTELSPLQVQVYDPLRDDYVQGGPFLEDAYIINTWTGQPCHNWPQYFSTLEKWQMNISYDMDFLIQTRKDMPAPFVANTILAVRAGQSRPFDLLTKKHMLISAPYDALLKKPFPRQYLGHSYFRKGQNQAIDGGMKLVLRYTWPLETGSLLRKALDSKVSGTSYLRGEKDGGYGMSLILSKSRFNEILIQIERFFPQVYDIRALMMQYRVYDSRRDGTPPKN